MLKILEYAQGIFKNLVSILNVQFFEDFPVTFLELILIAVILRYVFKFAFGGFKEFEMSTNWISRDLVSTSMSNVIRQGKIANNKRKMGETIIRLDSMGLNDLSSSLNKSYAFKYGEYFTYKPTKRVRKIFEENKKYRG